MRDFVSAGGLLLDVRDDQDFAAGHLRGAINVGLSGRFAEFSAAMHEAGQPIAIFGSTDEVAEARLRLARVGLDGVTAAVAPEVLLAAPEMAATASRVTSDQAQTALETVPGLQIVDVRAQGEHEEGALPGAVNLPLPRLRETLSGLDPQRPVLVHCAGGYRSSVAASLLRAHGFGDVSDLLGGYGAWTSPVQS